MPRTVAGVAHIVIAGVFLAAGFAVGRDLRGSADNIPASDRAFGSKNEFEAASAAAGYSRRDRGAVGERGDRSETRAPAEAPSGGDAKGVDGRFAEGRDRRKPRVLLAGDSVMAGLAPAVEAALEGEADVRFTLTPSILRDATIRFTWTRQLREFDPDIVVMFVTIWELGEVQHGRGQSIQTGQDGWFESYRADVLRPWVDLLTSGGARVVWVGAPSVADKTLNLSFAILNEAFELLEKERTDVIYVDSGRVLNPDGADFVPVTRLSNGTLVRTRQIDGLHLCPDGARLIAADVVSVIRRFYDVELSSDWVYGSWRRDRAYPPERCPPREVPAASGSSSPN